MARHHGTTQKAKVQQHGRGKALASILEPLGDSEAIPSATKGIFIHVVKAIACMRAAVPLTMTLRTGRPSLTASRCLPCTFTGLTVVDAMRGSIAGTDSSVRACHARWP